MGVKFLSKFLFFFFCFAPILIFAQAGFEISYPSIPGATPPVFGRGAETLISYIQYIFYFAITLGIVLSLVLIIFGGLRYLYARGNPQIVAQAKSQIFNAFLGLGILLFSLTILNSISPAFSQIEPTTLQRTRLVVNILRRIRINLNWQQLVQLISPTSLPLEVSYPMVEGFRPTAVPLETGVAPTLYPLQRYLARFVKYIYDFALILGVILAFCFLILGGVKWLTAGGNIGRVREAREQIFASLLGLLLLLGSWLILRFFRPEYTTLSPPELPDVELELEPGVYICTRPMHPNYDDDPMVRVLRCRDLKILFQTYGSTSSWPVPNCLFPKGLAKEIKTFAETQCLLIKTSQTLPAWLIGEPVDINKVREQLESASGTISDTERDEIIREWEEYNQNPFVLENTCIYINGPYGLVLHEERDFKGVGEIILKHNFTDFSYLADFGGGNVHDLNNYHYRFDERTFRSITLFEDRVVDCVLKTRTNNLDRVDISDCLGIKKDEDIIFTFYNLPDFGGLEEKNQESKMIRAFLPLRSQFTPNLERLKTVGGGGNLDPDIDPCYSIKFPSEENWVMVVGASRGSNMALSLPSVPIYVFDKSERNLEATYVGSFCQQGKTRIPCITHFFAWPGKILKEKK
jgi:hypothetical protein